MNETKCNNRVHVSSSFKRWDGKEGKHKGRFPSVFGRLRTVRSRRGRGVAGLRREAVKHPLRRIDAQAWVQDSDGEFQQKEVVEAVCLELEYVTHMQVCYMFFNVHIADTLLLVFHYKLFKLKLLFLSLCLNNLQLLCGSFFISSSTSK